MAANSGTRLETAATRLDRALTLLEQKLTKRMAASQADDLFNQDRARLAADLDAAQARQRELEEAGRQASEALALAIAELSARPGA
jgi:hypothetical protein